jgi:pimeloyl-ACP methyl ester carboxylesterase
MLKPAKSKMAVLNKLLIEWHGFAFDLPYLYREGGNGPAILFVHGLGGAKENFYAALQSSALADCTLVMFDLPGTGLAEFNPSIGLDVSALSEIAQKVAAALIARSPLAGGREHGRPDFAVAIPSIRNGARSRIHQSRGQSVLRRLHVFPPGNCAYLGLICFTLRADDA